MIREMQSAEETYCPDNEETHLHYPNWQAVSVEPSLAGIIDVPCVYCGRSGSIPVNPEDVMW